MNVLRRTLIAAVVLAAALVGGAISLIGAAVLLGPRCSVETARQVHLEMDLEALQRQLGAYKGQRGSWPTTEQGLAALASKPESPPGLQPGLQRYRELPKDPWNRDYQYIVSQDLRSYELFSLGRDGVRSEDDVFPKR